MSRLATAALTIGLFVGALAGCSQAGAQQAERALAVAAVSLDGATAHDAIAALRARGPAGLRALETAHASALRALTNAPETMDSAARERLRYAFDVVSGQRDGHASGLYFYDDLESALAEARRRHVPVLSLRLLGHLDQELSCANSRYFRTILYSDETVSRFLREHFVLHASTERPAPTITIDMGDGRTMVRTITGNSIHYVLDANGRVVDALPGLYAPPQFVAALTDSLAVDAECGAIAPGAGFDECRSAAHVTALGALESRWMAMRAAHEDELPVWRVFSMRDARRTVGPGAPSARQAMAETMSKMIVEAPVLDSIARGRTPEPYEGINWPRLVGPMEHTLSARTLTLVRLKTGQADVSGIAIELARNAMADGLRNEFVMHRRIHEWLGVSRPVGDFAAFNTRVYAELFLTPASDPWLGLRAQDVWDAIDTLH